MWLTFKDDDTFCHRCYLNWDRCKCEQKATSAEEADDGVHHFFCSKVR
jgi:hypothetical protein